MKNLIAQFSLIVSILLSSCINNNYKEIIKDRVQNFNSGWEFTNEDIEGFEALNNTGLNWRMLDLPHDWSIEDSNLNDTLYDGPFLKSFPRGDDVGYLGGGVGWYKKSFSLDESDYGKKVYLYFDGVQSEASIWVNGIEAGKHFYGYTAFYFDISSLLKKNGEMNQIAVRVFNPEENSRWFTGAGIFRDVQLMIVNPVHSDIWGVSVNSKEISESSAKINVEMKIINSLNEDVSLNARIKLISPDFSEIELESESITISAKNEKLLSVETIIENPDLWNLNSPNMYIAEISLERDGVLIDVSRTNFGIRSIDYSSEAGFILNGTPILLKGACMHHDNGLLGAAAFRRAEERRVQTMKDNGFNAIRTSHNPPSKAFLEACDKIGMLVIDESFDVWEKGKRPNDFHIHFKDWWKQELEAMVLRDRNHPSIIMWSFGNEVQERGDAEGLEIAAKLIETIKSLDTSRPITQAICEFWDNPGNDWDYAQPAFKLLDIGGYNYKWQKYESDHDDYPDRIIFGSESVPKEAFENWELVKKCNYVIGDFVWTGMDYIGESGIGQTNYFKSQDEKSTFLQPWPWYVSWCGDIDITGNKKPQSYYRDVVWGESRIEIAVHEPIPEGTFERVSFWGWPKEYQSWNWDVKENELINVNVYSDYPVVRLELNGKLIAEKQIKTEDKLSANFQVPYSSGELKASGIEDGIIKESTILTSSTQAAIISLIPESQEIKASRDEIVYIRVEILDSTRLFVPDAKIMLDVEVTGEGELLAAGNGSGIMEGSFQDNKFSSYNGKALIIVRSTAKKGIIEIKVSSKETGSEKIQIKTN